MFEVVFIFSRKCYKSKFIKKCCTLTVTTQVKTVATTPGSTTRATNGLRVAVAFAQAATALAGGGEATEFAVLVDCVADPVDLGITTDGVVVWIKHDHLEVLVGGILTDPVGVQDTETSNAASNTFLERKSS